MLVTYFTSTYRSRWTKELERRERIPLSKRQAAFRLAFTVFVLCRAFWHSLCVCVCVCSVGHRSTASSFRTRPSGVWALRRSFGLTKYFPTHTHTQRESLVFQCLKCLYCVAAHSINHSLSVRADFCQHPPTHAMWAVCMDTQTHNVHYTFKDRIRSETQS